MIKFSKDLRGNSEKDKAIVKDAILLIVSVHQAVKPKGLQYELMRCGIHITFPELKSLIAEIQKDGYLKGFEFNESTY